MERKIVAIDLINFMAHQDVQTRFKAFGGRWFVVINRGPIVDCRYGVFHLKVILYTLMPESINLEEFAPAVCEQYDAVSFNRNKFQPVTVYFKYREDTFALTLMFTCPQYQNVVFHIYVETPTHSILVIRKEYLPYLQEP